MTDHHEPADTPGDPVESEMDRRLHAAFREARSSAPRGDRHAFVAAARSRRDRTRRHRRAWLITTPIAAAVLIVVVLVGVEVLGGNDSTTRTRAATSGDKPGANRDGNATCPSKPGKPNTVPGEPLFDFTPTELTLCTYATDGRLVATNSVTGRHDNSVVDTLRYLERAYVDRTQTQSASACPEGTIKADRSAAMATDGTHHATAWFTVSGCVTPPDAPSKPTTTMPGAVSTPYGPATTAAAHGSASDLDPRCPETPAHESPDSPAPSNPVLDFDPTRVIVCTYDPEGDRWSVSIDDRATLQRIIRDLAKLEAPRPDLVCTQEMSSTLVFIAMRGAQTKTFFVENYGCGNVTDGTNLLVGGKSLAWATDGR